MASLEGIRPPDTNLEVAKSIFGSDFFGPDEIAAALGTNVLPDSLPVISFSPNELQQAKKLGQYLILRVGEDGSGFSLSINRIFKNELPNHEAFYEQKQVREQVPRLGWALVSKNVLPNSTNRDYLEQTEAIADYLKLFVFRNQSPSSVYADAFAELEEQKGKIRKLLSDRGTLAAASWMLEGLSLSRLTRPTLVELLFDKFVIYRTQHKILLPNMTTWTNSLSKYGNEFFGMGGPEISYYHPDERWEKRGAILSRLI